jgi:hypothetical protein
MRGTEAGKVGRAGVATLLALAACSNGGGSAALGALVEYAEGDWSCELTSTAMPGSVLRIDATVEADSSSHGTFAFDIESGLGLPKQEGEWRLDGTSLEMDVTDLSRYAAEGVELDTDRIEILEDARGAELQRVGVDRHGDAVTFSWTDPVDDTPVEMDCAKS